MHYTTSVVLRLNACLVDHAPFASREHVHQIDIALTTLQDGTTKDGAYLCLVLRPISAIFAASSNMDTAACACACHLLRINRHGTTRT